MTSKATTPQQYLDELPADRKEAVTKLRNTVVKNLPKGFKETMAYGMLGYVIPHEIYPPGYHCNPKLPLGFINIASQKNYISLYHMGLYGSSALLNWFVSEYPKHCPSKPDMGKCCIRFKKAEHIPYDLIKELVKKVSVKAWIDTYESHLKR